MLTVYTLEQSEKWDSVVRSFDNYDIYYLSGYVKAFYVHGDGEPLLFLYESNLNDGAESVTRGINVVMKRDISNDEHFIGKLPKNTYFDFSTPYGYGGWLIEGENTNELINEYNKWCVKNKIISEFTRFHPLLKNHLTVKNQYNIVELGKTVIMDLSSPEVIWANLTSKNRNVIRKAKKNGVKIYNGRDPYIYQEFRKIYNETMRRDDADSYYYFSEDFYKVILDELPENAQIFYACFEEKVIAAAIMLSSNGKLSYHLSGSLKEYSRLAASNLLLYEAALWGSVNGFVTFNLGGGVGSGEDGVFKFKRSFYRGEKLNHFYIGSRIFNNNEYDKLVKMRGNLTNNNYFPRYRG